MKELLGCLILSIMFFVYGMLFGVNKIRKEAIENNVAYYGVNSTNGVIYFQWKSTN